jgi:hypothetical protein
MGNVMDRIYGSWDHSWLLVHGELTTMGRCGRFEAREAIVIARSEREEVIDILTNGTTWR